jgi:hypothetical protein
MSNHWWDLTAGAGVLLAAAGLWWIWPPLCLVLMGLALVLFGVWGARIYSKDQRPRSWD